MTRGKKIIVFLTEKEEDIGKWGKALETYVI